MAETANSRDTLHREGKSAEAFRTISEVANKLDVPPHVLRFWETKFSQVKPLKRGGGRRYYRPEDVHLLRAIRELLYTDGYTIKGVQKLLREGGAKAVVQARDADSRESAVDSAPDMAVAVSAKHSETPIVDKNKYNKINDIISDLEDLRDVLRQG